MSNKMKVGIIYARQSSTSEEKEDKSESIKTQIGKCRELCKAQNITVLAEYFDQSISGRTYPDTPEARKQCENDFITMDFISKKKGNDKYRKGLAKVLSHFGKIDYVICTDTRRLARALSSSFLDNYLSQLFIKNKVELITLDKGIINFQNTSHKLVSVLESEIEDNAVKLSAKKSVEEKQKVKTKGGIVGREVICFGYKTAGNQEIMIIEKEAEIVKDIFRRYNAGESISAIARYLNVNNTTGRTWVLKYVKAILKRLAYTGYRKDENGNLIELVALKGKAIISQGDFSRAQARLNSNQSAGEGYESKVIHPLSGLLFCGVCGKALYIRGNSFDTYYYRCKSLLSAKSKECTETLARETTSTGKTNCFSYVSMPLKECLKPLLMKALLIRRAEAKNTDEIIIEKELIQNRLNSLQEKEKRFIKMNVDEEISDTQFTKTMQEIEERKSDLINKLTELNTKTNTSNDIFEKYSPYLDAMLFTSGKSLPKPYEFTDLDYRTLARATFKKIYVYKYHIHVIFMDGTAVTLERIVYGLRRNFPEILPFYDDRKKRYDFLVLQKSQLEAKQADPKLPVYKNKDQKTIYDHKDMAMICIGKNDTQERYNAEGLTYLNNLPKA